MGLPLVGSILIGMTPGSCCTMWPAATGAGAWPDWSGREVSAMAMRPGRMTMKGMNIFTPAAISGVLRAADMELAAMARWTTRKAVHQYPKDRTKPNPMESPNQSTPRRLVLAWAMPAQAWV